MMRFDQSLIIAVICFDINPLNHATDVLMQGYHLPPMFVVVHEILPMTMFHDRCAWTFQGFGHSSAMRSLFLFQEHSTVSEDAVVAMVVAPFVCALETSCVNLIDIVAVHSEGVPSGV
jgi:hypothetical protein